MKTVSFKVLVTNGVYNAPDLYVYDVKDAEAAITEAKSRSGLARFNNWNFLPVRIR